jgi:DNA polymerase III delta prime subunit
MGWRREIRDRIAELEQRRLRVEDERKRARMLGEPEGERLEAEAKAHLQELSQQINDLQASLE